MADVAKRLRALVGTIASFSADLFDGRFGVHTDGPAGGLQWGVRVAGVWQYAARGLADGWADNKGYKVNGVTAIDASRGGSFSSCQVGGVDVVTRAPVIREAIMQSLPITNSAPGVVPVGAGGMKSFGFDGNTVTEELFYHVDVQHDYIAGTNKIFHVHWMPATGAGGNVKWQAEVQWVEANGAWGTGTTYSDTVAAGTVALADKRADFILDGTGHTYNSRVMLRLFRVPTDVADTYSGDAILASVGMHYSADPGQP